MKTVRKRRPSSISLGPLKLSTLCTKFGVSMLLFVCKRLVQYYGHVCYIQTKSVIGFNWAKRRSMTISNTSTKLHQVRKMCNSNGNTILNFNLNLFAWNQIEKMKTMMTTTQSKNPTIGINSVMSQARTLNNMLIGIVDVRLIKRFIFIDEILANFIQIKPQLDSEKTT